MIKRIKEFIPCMLTSFITVIIANICGIHNMAAIALGTIFGTIVNIIYFIYVDNRK